MAPRKPKTPKKEKGQTPSGAPARDEFDLARFAARFSIPAAILNSDPELIRISRFVERNPDAPIEDIVLMIEQSTWGRKTTTNRAFWESFEQRRPADFSIALNEIQTKIETQFAKAGVQLNQTQAQEMARKVLLGSERDEQGNVVRFDQKWIDRQVAAAVDFTKTRTVGGAQVLDVSGSAEKVAQDLYSIAYNYGLDTSMSNTAFRGWFDRTARSVLAGDLTLQQADDEVVDMARSRFPGMSSYFDRGIDLRTAADPWLEVIKDVLEVGEVDLNDDLFQRIINGSDAEGNPRPMSLYEARLAARKDPRWDYTSQAKNEKTDIANKILQDFGFLG